MLDNTIGVQVKIYIDGNIVSTIPVNSPRSDVCAVYPQYAGCPSIIFLYFICFWNLLNKLLNFVLDVGYSVSVSTAGLSTSCSHLIHIVATDSHGNDSILGDRIIAFN